jgi:Domain of unknown function (DUF6794)
MNFEHINTLNDLATFIIERMPSADIEWITSFKNDEEDSFSAQAHANLGRNIRNNCKLWDENSHLHQFFKNTYGLNHADDMSGIILSKLFKVLHGNFREDWVTDTVDEYKNHWKMMEQFENGNGIYEIEFKGKKIIISRATITFEDDLL